MCEIILPKLDNIEVIHSDPKTVEDFYKTHAGIECSIYSYASFIDGTGYVEKVYQEIEFVISSNINNSHISSVNVFISEWGLEKYRNYKLSELSGGWKKYLGLALFTNINSEGKIYFDSFRQLSDRLIKMLIKNLLKTKAQKAYFIEYDINLFPDILGVKPITNSYKNLTISADNLLHNETNY